MCLGKLYSKRTVAKYKNLAKKKGYLRVYKEVDKRFTAWGAIFRFNQFKAGLNKRESACKTIGGYPAGFHCCPDKIKWLKWDSRSFVECLVKPEWIRTAGKQWGQTVLVCDKVFMPKYPSKKALVRDFKKETKNE